MYHGWKLWQRFCTGASSFAKIHKGFDTLSMQVRVVDVVLLRLYCSQKKAASFCDGFHVKLFRVCKQIETHVVKQNTRNNSRHSEKISFAAWQKNRTFDALWGSFAHWSRWAVPWWKKAEVSALFCFHFVSCVVLSSAAAECSYLVQEKCC